MSKCLSLLTDRKARGCSTNTFVINSVSHPLVIIYLRRRHTLMVEDGAFNQIINYIPVVQENLNFKGHLNRFIGSKVTEILVNGGILPSGGVASRRVCACSLRSRLVFVIYTCFVMNKICRFWQAFVILITLETPLFY